MENAALETLLKGVANGSVSPEKAAQLISSYKSQDLSDKEKNPALEDFLKGVASGSVLPEKAAQLISSNKSQELSDEELDKITGGSGGFDNNDPELWG